MQNDIPIKISDYIKELELACQKCTRGILKVDQAEQLIQGIRTSLRGMLPTDSDAYHLYNRHVSGNTIWWEVTQAHGYVELPNCSNIENEIKILKQILSEHTSEHPVNSLDTSEILHICKGERAKALRLIYSIMQNAKTSLVIIDPYLDNSIYDYITSLEPKVAFKILTNENNLKPIFVKTAKELLDEHWNIVVKSNTNYHDRYIIVDDTDIWTLGSSIKNAGDKEHTIVRITNAGEIKRIKEVYNASWEDSITLCDGNGYDVVAYRVDLQFPVFIENEDENTAYAKAKKQGEKWINKVEKNIGQTFQLVTPALDTIEYIATNLGNLKLKLNWKYRGFNGTSYFIASTMIIETSDVSALDKIIKAGQYPYWAIYYTLDSELNLEAIQEEMHKRTGYGGWIGGSSIDRSGNKNIVTLEYKNELGISIQLHRGSAGHGLIILSCPKGERRKGFKKAHEVFTPTKILSILNGEYSPTAFKNLVDKAS